MRNWGSGEEDAETMRRGDAVTGRVSPLSPFPILNFVDAERLPQVF
ncbi:MAG: hypothetical protein NHB32_13680 [Fischerella sp. CENA71]|nr:hypothetical protein [Fischerella sp. CENA71]